MSAGVIIDSCLFIDHMRMKDKTNTPLAKVLRQYTEHFIPTVVEYEIEVGMTESYRGLWNNILDGLTIIPFDSSMVLTACKIKQGLKAKGQQIDLADLFIAATAMTHDLPLATLNDKHFDQIDGLKLL
jgi:predicted nucleic acid-binding protein